MANIKTIKTEYSEDFVKIAEGVMDNINLTAIDGVDGQTADIYLSPKQARKVAVALLKAAAKVEAKTVKAEA